MAMPDDTFIVLETEVAALVGLMLDTLSSDAGPEVMADGISRYAEQVERIGMAAAEAGLLGLQDVCMVLQATLLELSVSGRPISNDERDLLEAWPTLVMAHLETPQDPHISAALVQHLQDPAWTTPLSDADADMMLGFFTPPAAALAEIPAMAPITSAVDAVDTDTAIAAMPATTPLEPLEPDAVTTESDLDTRDATLALAIGQADAEEILETVPVTEPASPPMTTIPVVDTAMEPAAAVIAPATSESVISMSDEAAVEESAIRPAFAEPEPAIGDSAPSEAEPVAPVFSEPEAATTTPTPDGTVRGGLSQAAQEVLEILCAEVGQFTESTAEFLADASAEASTPSVRADALTNYAEQLERFTEATAAVGLTGLSQVCTHIHANMLAFVARDQTLTADESILLEDWPLKVLDYLQAFDEQPVCQALGAYLQDSRWPEPLPTVDAPALVEALMAPSLLVEEATAEARPTEAQTEDISLALPEDVNPELLDGLLQELPNQTAEFSAAVQRLQEGTGTLEDLEVAQRIAHTLKGAGNTVGIRGVATLAHHIEDILLALSKHQALPPRILADSLINAADCLETMSESLLGLSEPPAQAQGVLQEVLDWANRIDREGIPKGDAAPAPRPPRPAGVEKAATVISDQSRTQTAAGTVPMLRVPATLVDELLRLIGESMILSGQIQERVHRTLLHTRAVQAQNHLLHQLTADLEQFIDIRGIASPLRHVVQDQGFDPLELEQYNELNSTTQQLVEAVTDTRALGQTFNDHLAALDALLVEQSRLNRESQDTVMRTRMVPVKTIVPRLQRAVRQTCRLTDKEAELQVMGAETLMDSNVLNDLVDPLMHVLRNAVDHGIETPAIRQSVGKNSVGRIALSFGREGNRIVVRCQDDGAGLDLAAIRRVAEQRGLVNPKKSLEEEELIRLTLAPGFSTRAVATQTSGRGIGMDMVYNRILEIKGSLQIQSKPGQGYLVEMRLPLTLISTHALLVQAQQDRFAISDRGVEQILYPGSGEIRQFGNHLTYQAGDNIYELHALESLLNLPKDRRVRERHRHSVVLVQDETGMTHAVLVEEILSSHDLVIKNMGQYIPKLRGVVGATILGDGSVVPVLDLPELLRAASSQQPQESMTATHAAPAMHAAPLRRLALVVDDSLSARRSLAQFVEDAGLEVRTARDGLEAVELINAKRPDIVLVDLEMPRMNGLELTAHMRARDDTRALPVIMVTSRSTEKHRHEAEKTGVNAYMTKPFAEDELLKQINRLLEHA